MESTTHNQQYAMEIINTSEMSLIEEDALGQVDPWEEIVGEEQVEEEQGPDPDKETQDKYENSVSGNELLTHEKEVRLHKAMVAGDDSAAWQLALSMASYILWLAWNYCRGALMRNDVCQEVFCGLAIATKKFDPSKGRYSTFAWQWIHKHMSEALQKYGFTVTIPRDLYYSGKKVSKALNAFVQRYGHMPSYEELAEESGLSLKDISKGMNVGCQIESWEERHDNMFLDDFGAAMDNEERLQRLNKGMACLDVRTHDILCLKYGIEGCEQMKVKDIAKLFDISEERVRQLEKSGLKKLRLYLGSFGYAQ